MTLTFTELGNYLPAGAIEFVGNNQVKLNFSQISNNPLTLDSSLVEVVTRLLQGLAIYTERINEQRASLSPPLPPIDFASMALTGTPQQPKYQFIVEVAVDTATFASNLA
ncbi:hypothetical protein [Scytonema millei]|uniref:Uncharacterized protein n=1 Tax=Scytonema millei VB511283 TaxID=1245923 RepID=A0A9X5EA43_9CYAN|nr:hypothetical protein [Scytonema millei]NHC37944.1 hypothetical protein [Scytonema millei VB511283]